ncbi:MAG: hypothetical protein WC119_02070 [Synergistaceae bacterium]
MSAKIYKLDKDTLAEVAVTDLAMDDITMLSIHHVHDSNISSSGIISFSLDISNNLHIPYIEEEEFMVVVRERIDATARGPNDMTINYVGDDIGKENYNEKKPYRPWELPYGFTELKGKNK